MDAHDCEETHPGFEIKCKSCGSLNVYVENTVGFSSTSGAWGSVDLICADCNASVEIMSAC